MKLIKIFLQHLMNIHLHPYDHSFQMYPSYMLSLLLMTGFRLLLIYLSNLVLINDTQRFLGYFPERMTTCDMTNFTVTKGNHKPENKTK